MRWTPPTLQTERLTLRGLELSDAPAIYEYTQRPSVAQFTLWEPHQNLEVTQSFIQDYAFKNYEKRICEPFGITLRESPDRVIGTCGAWWSSEAHAVMEMGYALSEEHWNRGYMSEAAQAVIDHCFGAYPVNRIQAHFKRENAASGRVMEKVGMKLEGTFRERIHHKGRFWDTVHYAILKSEWQT